MKKIIQITACGSDGNETLYGLTEDGEIYELSYQQENESKTWTPFWKFIYIK